MIRNLDALKAAIQNLPASESAELMELPER